METLGLSSLKAAAMERYIVATKKDDAYDYFVDLAYYCEPDNIEPENIESIKSAIDEAFNSKTNFELKNRVLENFILEKRAEETLKEYQMVLGISNNYTVNNCAKVVF